MATENSEDENPSEYYVSRTSPNDVEPDPILTRNQELLSSDNANIDLVSQQSVGYRRTRYVSGSQCSATTSVSPLFSIVERSTDRYDTYSDDRIINEPISGISSDLALLESESKKCKSSDPSVSGNGIHISSKKSTTGIVSDSYVQRECPSPQLDVILDLHQYLTFLPSKPNARDEQCSKNNPIPSNCESFICTASSKEAGTKINQSLDSVKDSKTSHHQLNNHKRKESEYHMDADGRKKRTCLDLIECRDKLEKGCNLYIINNSITLYKFSMLNSNIYIYIYIYNI